MFGCAENEDHECFEDFWFAELGVIVSGGVVEFGAAVWGVAVLDGGADISSAEEGEADGTTRVYRESTP